jgi:DNA-binding CsgD family transcriptional regulator
MQKSTENLTDRQLEMVQHLANGLSLDDIAKEMHLSKSSVGQSLTAAKRRVGANTLPHLVSIVIRSGVLYWEDDCTCVNTENRTIYNPTCPFHGTNGSMVARVHTG